jgi:hypothetical protein
LRAPGGVHALRIWYNRPAKENLLMVPYHSKTVALAGVELLAEATLNN